MQHNLKSLLKAYVYTSASAAGGESRGGEEKDEEAEEVDVMAPRSKRLSAPSSLFQTSATTTADRIKEEMRRLRKVGDKHGGKEEDDEWETVDAEDWKEETEEKK